MCIRDRLRCVQFGQNIFQYPTLIPFYSVLRNVVLNAEIGLLGHRERLVRVGIRSSVREILLRELVQWLVCTGVAKRGLLLWVFLASVLFHLFSEWVSRVVLDVAICLPG